MCIDSNFTSLIATLVILLLWVFCVFFPALIFSCYHVSNAFTFCEALWTAVWMKGAIQIKFIVIINDLVCWRLAAESLGSNGNISNNNKSSHRFRQQAGSADVSFLKLPRIHFKWNVVTWPRVSANRCAPEPGRERVPSWTGEETRRDGECWATAPSAGTVGLPHLSSAKSVGQCRHKIETRPEFVGLFFKEKQFLGYIWTDDAEERRSFLRMELKHHKLKGDMLSA